MYNLLNNIKLIDKAFDKIKEVEKKINYEYEPMYIKKNKEWKRNLFFKELKKDFVKDVTEFGFCPYIPKAFSDQQKNKSISKYSKIDNYSKLDYLKSLYKQVNPNENNKENNNKKFSITSFRMRKNKSTKDINNKKKYFLKKISNMANSNFNFKFRIKGINSKLKLKKNSTTLDLNNNIINNKKNSSMINFMSKRDKKDKSITKSENEFADAESFIYEPEKIFIKHNQNISKENEFYEEDTNAPKNNTIINNISPKRAFKLINKEIMTPQNINNNLKPIKPINYLKNLKGSFSVRNNNNNTLKIIKKNKNINEFFKKGKINKNNSGNKEFRLLAYSRKIKFE
jgi:hypothetical protein